MSDRSAGYLIHDLCTQNALFGCYISNFMHVCLLSVMLYLIIFYVFLYVMFGPIFQWSIVNPPIIAQPSCSASFLFNWLTKTRVSGYWSQVVVHVYMCLCYVLCAYKTSGQDAGGNTYNLHFINFYCNTCYNVNCFSSTFVWSISCNAVNLLISKQYDKT